jgi:hypothetical protein
MAKGISLNIGLNSVDPAHYSGWEGKLIACEADAEDMAAIAESKGFSTELLLTSQATRERVDERLRAATKALASGDILLLTYSGHGGQLPDLSGDEADQEDETWCLYDGELVDDELYEKIAEAPKGARVLVISDSCHSGTVIKEAFHRSNTQEAPAVQVAAEQGYRFMPRQIAQRAYRKNKELYDPILGDTKLNDARSRVVASALLISGCQDNQYSMDGTFNGLFTGNLLRTWNNGAFEHNYRRFHNSIVRLMPPYQTPNYYFIGAAGPEFEAQIPFTI